MVLIPHGTCFAETEIKVNIRKMRVGLILNKVSAIEIGMDGAERRGCRAGTKGQ